MVGVIGLSLLQLIGAKVVDMAASHTDVVASQLSLQYNLRRTGETKSHVQSPACTTWRIWHGVYGVLALNERQRLTLQVLGTKVEPTQQIPTSIDQCWRCRTIWPGIPLEA